MISLSYLSYPRFCSNISKSFHICPRFPRYTIAGTTPNNWGFSLSKAISLIISNIKDTKKVEMLLIPQIYIPPLMIIADLYNFKSSFAWKSGTTRNTYIHADTIWLPLIIIVFIGQDISFYKPATTSLIPVIHLVWSRQHWLVNCSFSSDLAKLERVLSQIHHCLKSDMDWSRVLRLDQVSAYCQAMRCCFRPERMLWEQDWISFCCLPKNEAFQTSQS